MCEFDDPYQVGDYVAEMWAEELQDVGTELTCDDIFVSK